MIHEKSRFGKPIDDRSLRGEADDDEFVARCRIDVFYKRKGSTADALLSDIIFGRAVACKAQNDLAVQKRSFFVFFLPLFRHRAYDVHAFSRVDGDGSRIVERVGYRFAFARRTLVSSGFGCVFRFVVVQRQKIAVRIELHNLLSFTVCDVKKTVAHRHARMYVSDIRKVEHIELVFKASV